ncbi:30S ribosomal protein S2 [Candidatus Bathyarchaeota archaeon]|nr:MAG: 30S ribosomal protein S2 [Candidatus Hecatellales archaeon]RLI35740.1 MAG: 30S ribosomal protein S2 [Candidatus Bathyarchaeota archaeon]
MAGEYEYLVPVEQLISSGIQIGTRIKTRFMEPYIYKVRPDGLFIIDTRKTDERIRVAAKFLASFPPKAVVAVSFRLYGQMPVLKFCEATGAVPVVGRFLPGTFTNPLSPSYTEPEVVLVTDPSADEQAIEEASKIRIPVVALCDTDNTFKNIDLVIPTNNKGRKALAMVYWLLARQVLRERGEIPPDGELQTPVEEFETKLSEVR